MKSILITGCSSGIGAHCAIQLDKAGWKVFASARRKSDLKHLEESGLTAVYLDYTDTDSIHAAYEKIKSLNDGKPPFALFNNGAYGQPGAVEDITTEVLRRQFEANVFGWHELTNLVLPDMRASGEGRIIQCSSILGWIPMRWRGAYVASKFALEGLSSSLRLELAGSGIYVSQIEPGPIATRFTENALEKLHENVDMKNSAHQLVYERELARLKSRGGHNRFRRGPNAVYKKLLHALTADKPRAHYGVTVPTHFMNFARRFLPQEALDWLLIRNS